MDAPDRRQIALALAIGVGLAGVASGRSALVWWAVALGAIAGAASWWARAAWREVDVQARFSPPRAFQGEPVTLEVRLANRKRLPLPIARLSVWLPPQVRPDEADGGAVRGFRRYLSLGGASEARLLLPVTPLARGEHSVELIEVELSDPFRLTPLRRGFQPEAALIVMPEPRIAVPMEVRRRVPFGAPAPSAHLFEERERFAGVRTYEPGDPLSRIHWKLTAHSGLPQTKLFEPTRSAGVSFFLDLSLGEPFWDAVFPDVAEDTIGWASFLARQAIGAGWRIGLVANTHMTRGRGPLRVPPSSAVGQEAAVFAALARMPNEPTSDLAPLLREAGRRGGTETTAVVISPRPGPWLSHEMHVLRRRGLEVVHLSSLERSS